MISAALPLFFLSLCIPSLADSLAQPRNPPSRFWRRASRSIPQAGYYPPANRNGSMLTSVPDTFPAGLGEPLNVILSANSDAAVLVDQENDGGLRNYYLSLGFSAECLGQHAGDDQGADLGDGNGLKNETAVIRWNYGDPALGACKETIEGGNHFRYWVQDGSDANSGAIFMGLSYEEPIAEQHTILVNGYNLGRDWLVGNATGQPINTPELSNSSTVTGSTSNAGYTYQTNVQYVSGLLQNTSNGINHFLSVGVNGTNAIDGLVAIMTVKITTKPASGAATPNTHWPWIPLILLPILSLAQLTY